MGNEKDRDEENRDELSGGELGGPYARDAGWSGGGGSQDYAREGGFSGAGGRNDYARETIDAIPSGEEPNDETLKSSNGERSRAQGQKASE